MCKREAGENSILLMHLGNDGCVCPAMGNGEGSELQG